MSELSDIEIADLLALPTDTAPAAPRRPELSRTEANAYMMGVAWVERWPRPKGQKPSPEEKAEIKERVINLLSDGMSLNKIAKAHNISYQAIQMWAKADADFNDKLNSANECYNESLADGLLDVHERHFNPAMAAVESKNTQWVLGVRDRNKYGAKLEVTETNAGLVDVLKAAIARIPRPDGGPMVDRTDALDLEAVDVTDLLALPSTHS